MTYLLQDFITGYLIPFIVISNILEFVLAIGRFFLDLLTTDDRFSCNYRREFTHTGVFISLTNFFTEYSLNYPRSVSS